MGIMFIAEVDSDADTGGGYYKCHLQDLDATDWDTTTADQVDDKGDEVIVLNLPEMGGSVWNLEAGDHIICFRFKDDEKNVRYVGVEALGKSRVENYIDNTYIENIIDQSYVETIIDSSYVENIIDDTYIKNIIDSTYIEGVIDNTYIENIIDSTYIENIIDSTYIENIIDSTYIENIIDSAYIVTIIDAAYTTTIEVVTDYSIDGPNKKFYKNYRATVRVLSTSAEVTTGDGARLIHTGGTCP